jgi:hypothetical protein
MAQTARTTTLQAWPAERFSNYLECVAEIPNLMILPPGRRELELDPPRRQWSVLRHLGYAPENTHRQEIGVTP